MEDLHHESLEEEATHATDEARMVLSGVQAILGLQLIAVFNQRFQDLTEGRQVLHLAAFGTGHARVDSLKRTRASGPKDCQCSPMTPIKGPRTNPDDAAKRRYVIELRNAQREELILTVLQ